MVDLDLEVYKLMRKTIAETQLPECATEWLGRLYDGEVEISDMMRDLQLVVYAPEIYNFLGILADKIISNIQNVQLKSEMEKALRAEMQTSYEFAPKDEQLDAIEAVLPSEESEEGVKVRVELDNCLVMLYIVNEIRENLMEAVENSVHKVFYDYVATLSTKEGVLLKDSAELLSEELGRLRRMEALMINSIDKKINELPMVKAEMHKSLLIPPGIVRGIASGSPVRHLMLICRAADRVGNYFLKTLNNEDPFGTSSFFTEAVAGKKLGSSHRDDQEVAKEQILTSSPVASVNMVKSASSETNPQENNNNATQNQPPAG